MTTKILICGDSYAARDPDPEFDGLHFSDKLQELDPDCEVVNLAMQGASNSLIELQVHQGMQFEPDHVVVLFTQPWRTEYLLAASPTWQKHYENFGKDDLDDKPKAVRVFNQLTYMTTAHCSHDRSRSDTSYEILQKQEAMLRYQSWEFIQIKNYFAVLSVLNYLMSKNVRFCFQLGGMQETYDEIRSRNTLSRHFLTDELQHYLHRHVDLNLWQYGNSNPDRPSFHVNSHEIQTSFAEQCLDKMELITI